MRESRHEPRIVASRNESSVTTMLQECDVCLVRGETKTARERPREVALVPPQAKAADWRQELCETHPEEEGFTCVLFEITYKQHNWTHCADDRASTSDWPLAMRTLC